MRIWFLADLHQEFPKLSWGNPYPPEHDVLVLAGDIHQPGALAVRYARSLTDKPVVMVAGNHEAYGREWYSMIADAKEEAKRDGQIFYLENNAVQIGDTHFIGAALWTDFEYHADRRQAALDATNQMNDFRLIRVASKGPRHDAERLTVADSIELHNVSQTFIAEKLKAAAAAGSSSKTVVVTHHAPIPDGSDPKFAAKPRTSAFVSDMTAFIEHHEPAFWLHGHTHFGHDTKVGATRVVSNQRGYGSDVTGTPFNPNLTLEI